MTNFDVVGIQCFLLILIRFDIDDPESLSLSFICTDENFCTICRWLVIQIQQLIKQLIVTGTRWSINDNLDRGSESCFSCHLIDLIWLKVESLLWNFYPCQLLSWNRVDMMLNGVDFPLCSCCTPCCSSIPGYCSASVQLGRNQIVLAINFMPV